MQGTSFAKFRRWSALSLLNFALVSFLGVILRYKIVFPLPAINYNFLLEAHSHFAFSGWISTAIFTALVYILSQSGYSIGKIYTVQFRLAQTASFGMLLSFSVEGYGFLSMLFSMLFILFSWWFALQYCKDVGKSNLPSAIKRWAKTALFFFLLSGIGILALAYLKSHKIDSPELYFSTLYLYLHFQYNGWFSFGVLTLFFYKVYFLKIGIDMNKEMWIFRLMLAACIPAYFLSLLWMNPPAWVFTIGAAAALLQLGALILLFFLLKRSWAHLTLFEFQTKLLWGLSFTAFTIKLILQALSAVPVFGRLSFGFRPVIIAYLHLVLLGFISFFLVGFFIKEKLFSATNWMWKKGLFILITGVVLMEILLLIQALTAINASGRPFLNTLLFIAATILFGGIFLMLISQLKSRPNNTGQDPISGRINK